METLFLFCAVQRYCRFLLKTAIHPYSTRIFGCSLWIGLDCWFWGATPRNEDPKLLEISYLSHYFRTNPSYTTTVHQRHRRTDRRTNRRTTYDSALHYVQTGRVITAKIIWSQFRTACQPVVLEFFVTLRDVVCGEYFLIRVVDEW